MFAIPAGYYTINSSSKLITLSAPYNTLGVGQVNKIINITGGEVIYDADNPRYGDAGITMVSGSITYKFGNNVNNTDKFRILIDAAYVDGGSA